MMNILILSFMILYAAFVIYLTIVAIRIRRPEKNGTPEIREGMSVIIPVKNEELNIPPLLESLARQDYSGPFEILFVDDGSIDATRETIGREAAKYGIAVRCIGAVFNAHRRLTSKQQAVDLGIKAAVFPVIALTDADMKLHENWLTSLAEALHPGDDLVFGHTVLPPESSPFAMFQTFQLEVLFAVAAVFHHGGLTGSCMGNNMALRKSAYLECGGYDAVGYCITEDRALLHHFRRKGKTTSIVTPFHPTADTVPHRSARLFYRQIVRWARGGFTNGAGLLLFGVIFAVENGVMLLGMTGFAGWSLASAGWITFLLTWVLIGIMFHKNRSPVSPLAFPIFYLLLQIELAVIVPALPGRSKIDWKGVKV